MVTTRKKPTGKVEVEQDQDEPVSSPVLADAIVRIADAMHQLLRSGLNRKAIEVLVRHKSGVKGEDIAKVLDALTQLRDDYCRRT